MTTEISLLLKQQLPALLGTYDTISAETCAFLRHFDTLLQEDGTGDEHTYQLKVLRAASPQKKGELIVPDLDLEIVRLAHQIHLESHAEIYNNRFSELNRLSTVDLDQFHPKHFISRLFMEGDQIVYRQQEDGWGTPFLLGAAMDAFDAATFNPFPIDIENSQFDQVGRVDPDNEVSARWPYVVFDVNLPIDITLVRFLEEFPVAAITSDKSFLPTVYLRSGATNKTEWQKAADEIRLKFNRLTRNGFSKRLTQGAFSRLPTVIGVPYYDSDVDIVYLGEPSR